MLYVLLAVVAVVVMAAVGFFGLRLLTQSADDGASGFTVEDPVALSPSDASGSEYPSEDPVHAPTPQYQSSTSEERQPADLPARVNRRNEPSLEETYAANQGYEEGKADPPGGVQNATVDIASGAETGPTYQGPSGPVDLPDGGTNTADDDFIAAAFEGPVERVLDLIGRGANRNGRDEAGRTPLMMAVLGGDPDIVGILAATGADLNATDTDGRTALHYAIDPFVVDILLGEGANPNARDRSGVTPLMEAADAGEPDTVMMLLDYGADPNIRDAAGRTAMSIARQNGFDDISQVLAEGRGGG